MSHSPHPALAGRSHFPSRLASQGLSNLATIVSTLVTVILPVLRADPSGGVPADAVGGDGLPVVAGGSCLMMRLAVR